RLDLIIDDILQMSRRKSISPQQLVLVDWFNRLLNDDLASIKQFIQLQIQPDTSVWFDPLQLQHILVNLLQNAHAALVASGTATLETALFKVPQVVLYRGGAISVGIARLVIKIRFISLVNLIMDKKVVEELIQQDCNTQNISAHLKQIVEGKEREAMLQNYEELANLMGSAGASERTAKLIVKFLTLPA
ncbi:MAG: lipid-A-disaccharide synthase, partial [Pedobacter sp.]